MTADMQVRLAQLEAQMKQMSAAPGSAIAHGEQLVSDASKVHAAAAELEQRFTELWRQLNAHPTAMWLRIEKLDGELKAIRAVLTPDLRAVPSLLADLQKSHADLSELVLERSKTLNELDAVVATVIESAGLAVPVKIEEAATTEQPSLESKPIEGAPPEPEQPKPPE